MNGELACRDCGSNCIIDEVVDFCGKCRSYNIGFRFENAEFEIEESEEEYNLRVEKERIKNLKLLQENAISASKIFNIFDTIMNIGSDYDFEYRIINKKENPKLLDFKDKFMFTNLPNEKQKIKNGELKPIMIKSIIESNLRKIKNKAKIFQDFNLKTKNVIMDISIVESLLDEIDFNNRSNFNYFNDFEDAKSWDYYNYS